MASTIPSSTRAAGNLTGIEKSSPPWHLIHFDVHCARCGRDLRGQVEPVCPACRLEFDWSDAAPLEKLTCGKCSYHLYGLSDSRCPECGTSVEWNEALLRYRTAQKPLFEYRWRQRPIRSFFRTWLLALRPKRLWQSVDIHDPPQVRPLIIWTIILLGITMMSVPFWLGISLAIGNIWQTRGASVPAADYFEYIISTMLYLIQSPTVWMQAFWFVHWWIFTFAALMVFQQSMRLCKVRSVHVLRVCAYSLAPLFPLYVFLFSGIGALYTASLPRTSLRAVGVSDLAIVLGLLGFLYLVWSIRQAYRSYIRMPHTLGVAFASQVIAILATAAIPPAVILLIKGGW